MEELQPGDPQQIGGYRLLARLGAGGMGQVYVARSDRGRTVAVKLVREELARQDEFRARFRQEVEAARRVGGYWTAPVLDADTEAAVPWVATGYVAGPSLQQVVGHDHGALPERSVRILAAGLAHALQDIHAAGIIHRDLKPSNVLVTIDGPRVIDFGIARAMETPAGDGLTRTGSLVGSPGFMAPEQVRGDRITPACDVFCLGSVLAYAATGVLPFGSDDRGAHALMFRIAQEEPDLAGVPEGIADLVRECLRKDPAARPGLAEILERSGAEDTVAEGRSRDPWLPGALVAQLGRHAVRLLDAEDPAARPPAGSGPDFPLAPPVQLPPPGAGGAVGGAGSVEHAPVGDGGAGGTPVADHTPTVVPGGTPPPAYGAPAGAYGYPQQHPQQQPYASPYGPPSQGTPPYGPPSYATPSYATPSYGSPSYGPPPVAGPPEPARRNGRSSVLLVVVALVVALGAGGSVYALMNRGGSDDKGDRTVSPAPTVSTNAPPTPTTSGPPSPTGSASPTPSASADGAIPQGYLGTWRATIDTSDGASTRELTIRQGKVGDSVLTLVADGPTDGGGTYHCVFDATLAEDPGTGGPLEIGPSTVTSGEPATSCTPGEATEVTLLPDGRLRRAKSSGGESLTYSKE
ncbi:serine/threonine-protein kinase [Streptomyces sp. NK08204]|uniref:serine/threonine-protein kinase n=1 Tax=Streptomyces sp. NK08204 TaxID=2873260 RepID=UPI001CEDA6D0|nr:serine/threonine-protein kinase [Streptomyces sp. NK08204]